MPNQGKIINAANICLKQKQNIDFELNKEGVCAGLVALYIKKALEKKTPQFFTMLDRLANLPSDYRLGNNSAIDQFIIQIEKAFDPSKYSGFTIRQGELEKILHIGTKPLRNEFNLGLTTDESQWKEIFKKIGRENRSYFIASKTHAIALSFENGKYTVYDPNYNKRIKEFDSIDELIEEIKDCFQYNNTSFGLVIRTFANPNAAFEHYPTHEELYQMAFSRDLEKKDTTSSAFAAIAGDVHTLKYLLKEHRIDLEHLGKEYLLPEFNDLLVQQPKSATLKNALLLGINANFSIGTIKEAEKLIQHYQNTFTSKEDQDDLKNILQKPLSEPVIKQLTLMKKEANYSKLLLLFAQFNLDKQPNYQTSYNHLQLLTFLNQETDKPTITQFLQKLPAEQIIKQIQYAAITNQQNILTVLIQHLTNTKIDPKLYPSVFTQEVMEQINISTLSRLLDHEFRINTQDPDLLLLCMQRKDKSIFETYARIWAEQTKQPTLWNHIDKHEYRSVELKTSLGSVSLLNALIFLRKNELVKKAWKDDLSEELIKNALTTAILNENTEMSLFLQGKLESKKYKLEEDTLEFLYQKGLEEEDLSILSILTQLNFNVLQKTQDIRPLLELCYDYDDYTIFDVCLEKANLKIKQLILENSLKWNITPIIELCAKKEPQLFTAYLNDSITKQGQLTKLNKVAPLLPPNTLSLQLNIESQKKFIKETFKNKFFQLTKALFNRVTWNEIELNEFIEELIQDKNEGGIIGLLTLYPKLKEKPGLIELLAQNGLLKPLDFLLSKEYTLEPNLAEKIFVAALLKNHKNLVERFLQENRVTPQTMLKHPLQELLKQAIEKGNDSVLDPFIQSDLDFGINFKELFLFCCAQKQQKIANQLLAKELNLSRIEAQSVIKQLFGEQQASALFETVYLQGYGRLYQLLLKANIENPRSALLRSIKNPGQDSTFQQTELYLKPLKRAIKEKNETIFNALFTQSNLPSDPDKGILNFLQDPVIFASVLPLFEKKYGLKKLIAEALKQQEWATVAHLIEQQKLNELDLELQQLIQEHGIEIIQSYRDNLEAHYDKIDVRPQLFQLLDDANPFALAHLALPYREVVQKTIERIELTMLEKQLDLNNQVYRHTLSTQSFKNALDELGKIFNQCQNIIAEQQIDLEKPIENLEVINNLAQIKIIMAGHDIAPYYLSDEHTDLLEQLIENSRLKPVCQLEFKLYCLLKQFNLEKKPLASHNKANQDEFNHTIQSLYESLQLAKLPIHFVLPGLQIYLQDYQTQLCKPSVPVEKEDKILPPSIETKEAESLSEGIIVEPSDLDISMKNCPPLVQVKNELEESLPTDSTQIRKNESSPNPTPAKKVEEKPSFHKPVLTQPHVDSPEKKDVPPTSTQKRVQKPSISKPTVTQSNLNHLKKRCIGAVNFYLQHRDQTLSCFSYFFDYYRGQIRAQHYKKLIQLAQTEQELYLIEYAILANGNGTQLKKDVAKKLHFKDENTAKNQFKAMIQQSYSEKELMELDKLIDSINQKANANNENNTRTLFHDELSYLKQIRPPHGALSQNSFFQPQKKEQKTGFWQWIINWFSSDKAPSDENRLSAH